MKAHRPTIVLTHPFIPTVVEKELKPFARVQIARSKAELHKLLPKADGLITRLSDSVNDELLARAPRLKAIANFAVGVNNIDFEACRKRGIRVCNTPDVLT